MTVRPGAIGGIFLLALIVRLLAAAIVAPEVDWGFGDIVEYDAAARAVFRDAPVEVWTAREPGYPLFLRIAYALPGSEATGVALLQALLGALGAAAVVFGLRGLLTSRVGWVAGAWVAVCPDLVWIAARPLRENLVVPLLVLSMLWLVRGVVRRRNGDLAVAVAALIALVHVDARFLAITAVVPFAMLALEMRWRTFVRGVVLAAIVAAATVPYSVAASRAAGHPVVLAERTLGKWVPRAVGGAERAGPRATVTPPPPNAPAFPVVAAQRFVEYWRFARLRPGRLPYPDLRDAPSWSLRHNVAGALSVLPILLLAPFAWRARSGSERRVLTFLVILLAAHCLLHVAVHARARYRIPVEALWAIPVAAGAVARERVQEM